MKIAVVSDLHIGCDRFADDALSQARQALEMASAEADAVLLPGDIFDKRFPRPEVMADAIELFRPLLSVEWKAKVESFKSKGTKAYTHVPVIAISGTHERTAEGKDNPLSVLALAGLLIDTSEATTILEKDGERVSIFGLGGLSEDHIKEKLKQLAPEPEPGAFNIFMFHQSLYEMLPFNESFMRYDDLPDGFDLYLCGHIHNRLEATVHGKKLLIPGSTVLTQLKEAEQERKGFLLIDTAANTHKFEYIDSRRFVVRKLTMNAATPESVREACEREVASVLADGNDNPLIRLDLEGTIKDGFSGADLGLRSLSVKYAGKATVHVDGAHLASPATADSVEAVRDGRFGDMSVKERGLAILAEKLKEQKFEMASSQRLFEALSENATKDKALKAALDVLNEQQQA